MRSTAAPYTGKIQNAASLGDRKCRLHTVFSLAAKAPILQCVVNLFQSGSLSALVVWVVAAGWTGGGGGSGSSTNAMMELLAENEARKNKSKFGLAQRLNTEHRLLREKFRARTPEMEHRFKMENRLRINSMTELMDRVRSGEIWDLRVDASDREVVWFGGSRGKIEICFVLETTGVGSSLPEVKVTGTEEGLGYRAYRQSRWIHQTGSSSIRQKRHALFPR